MASDTGDYDPAPGARDRTWQPEGGKDLAQQWRWNAADDVAISEGCLFDEKRGEHFTEVCRTHFLLWEGEWAGQPMKLLEYQYQFCMRLFGWVRWSNHFKRWVRRFRKSSLWVAKKNAKSPLGAAVGLYLLRWDGEPGANVYSAAKDGQQARIVHRHAQNMVGGMKPLLQQQFGVNRTTGTIAFPSANSMYSTISADNIRGQEGLNGSVVIDEVHVVDDRLVQILENMGVSRAEPMQFEISTVGNNPEGYGRKQYEYGKRVESGEIKDTSFLFKSHEAPQDITDEALTAVDENGNPTSAAVDLYRLANPAWGHIIDPLEYISALRRSRRSTIDWINFKQRRIQIWQQSTNPWLTIADWNQCKGDVTLEDFRWAETFVGLDLSHTVDMTAAVLVARDEEGKVICLPHFWLPRGTVEKKGDLVPFVDWQQAGLIEISEGRVINTDDVFETIKSWHEDIIIKSVVYDRIYAEDVTRRMEDELGIERFEFPQTITNYAAPCAELEKLIISKQMRHSGNAVMDWQVGHVQVRTDCNQNKRPVKPEGNDVRKIDGIVAMLMGLGGVMQSDGESRYESEGLQVF